MGFPWIQILLSDPKHSSQILKHKYQSQTIRWEMIKSRLDEHDDDDDDRLISRLKWINKPINWHVLSHP